MVVLTYILKLIDYHATCNCYTIDDIDYHTMPGLLYRNVRFKCLTRKDVQVRRF